jgi:hypothetical protein
MFEFMPKWIRAEKAQEMAKMEEGVTEISAGAPTPEEDDGGLHKVPLTTIVKVESHPNADRLELAYVYGFQVIV